MNSHYQQNGTLFLFRPRMTALTHHQNVPSSPKVHFNEQSSIAYSVGLDRSMTTYSHHCNVSQSTFTAHENVCTLYPSLQTADNHSSPYCFYRSAFCRMAYSWNLFLPPWNERFRPFMRPLLAHPGVDRTGPAASSRTTCCGFPASPGPAPPPRGGAGFLLTGRPQRTQVPVGCAVNSRAASSGPLLWAHPCIYP